MKCLIVIDMLLVIQLVECVEAPDLVSARNDRIGHFGFSGQRISDTLPLIVWSLSYLGSHLACYYDDSPTV